MEFALKVKKPRFRVGACCTAANGTCCENLISSQNNPKLHLLSRSIGVSMERLGSGKPSELVIRYPLTGICGFDSRPLRSLVFITKHRFYKYSLGH